MIFLIIFVGYVGQNITNFSHFQECTPWKHHAKQKFEDLLMKSKAWDLSDRTRLYRSRQALSNGALFIKIGVDTEENEPI